MKRLTKAVTSYTLQCSAVVVSHIFLTNIIELERLDAKKANGYAIMLLRLGALLVHRVDGEGRV